MQWQAFTQRRSAAVLIVAVTVLCGCNANAPQDAAPSSPALVSSDSSANTPPAGSGNNDGGQLAWVPPGPVDPADPPQSQWYVMLENKDCEGLAAAVGTGNSSTSDGIALWGAATALCRAVYEGQPSGWTDAAAGLGALQEPAAERCLDRAAYLLVAAFLGAHAQNPDALPSPTAGTGTACPLGLAGLDALDGQGPTRTPSSGLAGGLFQLSGRFLDVIAVIVGDQRVPVSADPVQPARWNVLMPAAAAAGAVTVTAVGREGPIPGSVTFTYVTGAPGSANPSAEVTGSLPVSGDGP
ncbi:hypothetical protein AAGW05_10585 [Arthrobacter sp. LAPM80]|uniref:hypothetical protein n=1 Tax=Arthrobacter sp. LAPM80 TaxID=3141788 RepID=UPI00398AC9E2